MLAVVLWLLMLVFAVGDWFIRGLPGAARWTRWGFTLVHAAFGVWVVAMHFSTVGFPWVVVMILLLVVARFRNSIERALGRHPRDRIPLTPRDT